MPPELAKPVGLLLTHSVGSDGRVHQFAGMEAMLGPQGQVEAVVAAYQRRRDVIIPLLNALPGFNRQTPQGAFYAFPNITGTGMSSDELAN